MEELRRKQSARAGAKVAQIFNLRGLDSTQLSARRSACRFQIGDTAPNAFGALQILPRPRKYSGIAAQITPKH
jgi:hypothetical protein